MRRSIGAGRRQGVLHRSIGGGRRQGALYSGLGVGVRQGIQLSATVMICSELTDQVFPIR